MRPDRRILVSASVVCAAGLAAAGIVGCRPPAPAPAPIPAPPPAILIPPLHDAQPGEQLRMSRGDGEVWTWRVATVTDEEVEVECLHFRGGEAVGPATRQRWTRNGFGLRPDYVIREFRRDRIEVAGKEWVCWLLRVHSRQDAAWYWITDELPVAGFLRVTPDDGKGRPRLDVAVDVDPAGSSFPR